MAAHLMKPGQIRRKNINRQQQTHSVISGITMAPAVFHSKKLSHRSFKYGRMISCVTYIKKAAGPHEAT